MTCQQAQTNVSLYLYGELDFAQEEAFERHLHDCALCQLALAREKEWHASVNAEREDVSFQLLSECRRDLRLALQSDTQRAGGSKWRNRLVPFGFSATRWSVQLAAGSFLVFIGFAGARLMETGHLPSVFSGNFVPMGLVNPADAQIRDIQPAGQNGVRITFDRVQQQEVTGTVNDDAVRRLLLAAIHDASDPAIRVNSVEMLQNQTGTDVCDALLNSAKNDSNAAVRIKALEGLRQFTGDPATREGIEYVLKHDNDPDVRSEAIDILVPANHSVPAMTPDVLSTLQDILNSERESDYVRSRSMQALEALNASSPVY